MALSAEDRTRKTIRAAILHKGLHDHHVGRRDEAKLEDTRKHHHERVVHHGAHFERHRKNAAELMRTVLPSEAEGKKAFEEAVEHVNKHYGPPSRFRHEEAREALRRVERDLDRDVEHGAEELESTASIGDIDDDFLRKQAGESLASYALHRALAEHAKHRLDEKEDEEERKRYRHHAKEANHHFHSALHYKDREHCEKEAPFHLRAVRSEYGHPLDKDFDRERAERDAERI